MGQNNCKCGNLNSNNQPMPKCFLLKQQMLTEFEIPDKQNYHNQQDMTASYAQYSAKMAAKYTDLLLALSNMNTKFKDTYFQPLYSLNEKGEAWARLSEKKTITKVPNVKISKFCQIFKSALKNYQELSRNIKPIYNQRLGLAVCQLWVNGNKTQILIDDFLPFEKLSYEISPQILLLQKAFAKVLGQYKYIEAFTIGELLSQVTGIPHYENQTSKRLDIRGVSTPLSHHTNINSFKNFKDALKCNQVLYQTTKFSSDPFVLGIRKGYNISSISFQNFKHKTSILKMSIPSKQTVSIRLIQQSIKYKDTQQSLSNEYNPIYFECFEEKNGRIRPFGQSYHIENCIYVNSIFSQMKGIFYIYVRQFKEESQRLSIVGYSNANIRFSEVFNENQVRNFMVKQIKQNLLEKNLQYEDIGQAVTAGILQTDYKICFYFKINFPRKILKVTSKECFILLQDEESKWYHELPLQNVAGKWLFILPTYQINWSKSQKCYKIFDISQQ